MALYTLSTSNTIATVVVFWLTYFISNIIYNLYFHPLARFPGPLLMRVSRIPYILKFTKGILPYYMVALHKQYGEIVRVAPDELAFANSAAWNDIQGHRTKGQLEMEKSAKFYRPIKGMTTDIITADREEHGKLRRTLAHGFSEKALRDQQPLIKKYIDLLVQRLHENCAGGSAALDLTAWYNFATFDIIGDLAFGEPFGCLKTSQYHTWVSTILSLARVGTIVQSLAQYPTIKAVLDALVPFAERMDKQRQDFLNISKVKLKDRMEKYQDRPDLVEPMLKRADEWGLTLEKLQANSSLLILAGSETTATQLCGVTYHLMANPDALQKATKEIRSAFKSEEDINFITVNELTYMNACLNESFRLYPPVAGGLPRIVPPGGARVCGEYIAEGQTVAVHHFALYRDERLWKDAQEYHPERWLGDPRFADDQRDALQPFHVGPRNCLGRNLAYVEMRTILARTLWNFDLKINDESLNWLDQKNFSLWAKPSLMAYLRPR
ncbi:cytochrome P450 [Truncatella angustata]|uniref:Cytochrome P450 n=1 Tax=Truncatella angustata TaxID=152316 RepID=A0A9P9A3A8_9PEZI|nr:cytochrome P450 [Truncatella angustata]KAH6660272.1 cytochrome P450 [Truncatella angustata]